MFNLQSKIVLVTGAGSGIGAAIAETFIDAKASLYVTDRDAKSGAAVAARLRGQGRHVEFIALDVANEEDCAEAARQVHQKHGRLDILVNNAGIGHVGSMLQTTGADLDRLYAVNVRGVFNVTKIFLPAIPQQSSDSRSRSQAKSTSAEVE